MKSHDWDDLKTKGIAKWIHRLYMLITWPLRKPVWAAVLIVIIAVGWYYQSTLRAFWKQYENTVPVKKVAEISEQTTDTLNKKIDNIKQSVSDILPQTDSQLVKEIKPQDKFIAWNVAAFHKAVYSGKTDSVKQEMPNEPTFAELKKQAQEIREKIAEKTVTPSLSAPKTTEKKNIQDYYVVLPTLKLNYLEKEELLEGQAVITDANSLYINGTYLFLYGVYTNPATYNTATAQNFLQTATENKNVRCFVVAYTQKTNIATALCFVDGLLLNQALVERNLAKNVALR